MGILHGTTKAVRDMLAVGIFSLSIDPQVSYDAELALEDMGTLHVDVMGASLVQVPSSRISIRYDIGIDIAVRYRFGVTDQVASTQAVHIDLAGAYIDLLEELAEHLADSDNRTLSSTLSPSWSSNEMRLPWVPEHMRQNRQYTGIMRATYFADKDL